MTQLSTVAATLWNTGKCSKATVSLALVEYFVPYQKLKDP